MTIRHYTRRPTTVLVAGPWDETQASLEEVASLVKEGYEGISFFSFDGPGTAEVWNKLEACWINVPLGHHIVRGTRGECYPIAPELLDPNNPDRTYDRTYDLTESTNPVT